MRTLPLIVFGVLFSAAAFAADPISTKPDPKLAEMLSAKDDKGQADRDAGATGLLRRPE